MKRAKEIWFRLFLMKSSIDKIVDSNIQHMYDSNCIDITLFFSLKYLFYILSSFLFILNKFSYNVCDSISKSMHNELQITLNDSSKNQLKIERFLEIKFYLLRIFFKVLILSRCCNHKHRRIIIQLNLL